MKYIILLITLLVLIVACKKEINEKERPIDNLRIDTLSQEDEKPDFTNSKMVINPETGDTLYLDFIVDKKLNDKKVYNKFYVITTYSSYTKDNKLEAELAKWKKLEANSYIEEVKLGQASKYFVALGKYNNREQVIEVWEKFKKKYPSEMINFQAITQ